MKFYVRNFCFLAATTAAALSCGDNNKLVIDAAQPDAARIDARIDAPLAIPTAVTNFKATAGVAREIGLTWTNPSTPTLAGVLIVASTAPITFVPADGTAYTLAQMINADVSVVSIANTATATFKPAKAGLRYQFAAWAFNGENKYSPIALTSGLNNLLGSQNATLSVDLVTNVITVGTQPTDINIEPTSVATYDSASQTLTLSLTVRNKAARLLFNLKALSSTLSQGSQSGDVFPPTGAPMTFFSSFGLAPDATITQTVTITGVSAAASPFTMNLDLFDAPNLIVTNILVDSSGSGRSVGIPTRGNITAGTLTADGRTFYVGSRRTSDLSVIDMTTTQAAATTFTLSTAVTGDIGSIAGLALSLDNNKAYAAFNDGAHYQGTDGQGRAAASTLASVQLVEIVTATNTEARRLEIVPAGATSRAARHITISPDGSKAAILVTGTRTATKVIEVYFVDLATFAVIDTDPNMVGVQPVSLPIASQAAANRYADAAIWDGNKLFVEYIQHHRTSGVDRSKVPVSIIDTTTFVTSEIVPDFGSDRSCGLSAFAGKLFYCSGSSDNAFSGGITVVDLATNVQTQLFTERAGYLAIDPLQKRLFAVNYNNSSDMRVFDLATNAEIDMDNNAGNGVTPIASGINFRGHNRLITPF